MPRDDQASRIEYEWLALRCQSGETEAFEDLIAVMERPLLYYAMSSWVMKTRPLDTAGQLSFLGGVVIFVLLIPINGVRLPIYASQVATLKEIKQVQLQLLEVQARLEKSNAPNT